MIKKIREKEKAVKLRREGKTYTEILNTIPVAKSTLSIWLKEVGIAKAQKQTFTTAKRLASLRGGMAKRNQRIKRQQSISLKAKSEIDVLSRREIFLIGVALYWAEGTKEKEYRPGSGVAFSNMDPKMIIFFLKWLRLICEIPKDMIGFEIMVHKSHKHRIDEVKRFWAKTSGFSISCFSKVYFKNSKIGKTKRRNIGEKYNGVLKIQVKKSSELVRRIASWSEAIYWGVV